MRKTAQSTQSWASKFHAYGDHHTYKLHLTHPHLKAQRKLLNNCQEATESSLKSELHSLNATAQEASTNLRQIAKDKFIIADLKTLDVGKVEVDIAYEDTADAVVAAGLAPPETLDATVHEARRLGIYAVIDMLNVEDVLGKLKSLKEFPDIVILHRGIDQESGRTCGLERIKIIRQAFPNKKFLIAVAGGIVPETAKEALEQGADILIVGRYVTQSKDIERSVRDFLELTPSMREDIDLYRVHTE